jgi:hypothetical protein
LLVPLTGKAESEKHDGRDGDAGEQRQQYREEVPDVPRAVILARNSGVSENPD